MVPPIALTNAAPPLPRWSALMQKPRKERVMQTNVNANNVGDAKAKTLLVKYDISPPRTLDWLNSPRFGGL